MNTLAFFIILTAVLILYLWVGMYTNKREGNTQVVHATEAGPSVEADKATLDSMSTKKMPIKLHLANGNVVSSADFIRIRVVGNCMMPREIINGEEWLAESVNPNKDKSDILNEEDVLLINIEDKGIWKIREYESTNPDGTLHTLYYDSNGNKHYSSKPHEWNSVIGILRYCI